MRTTKSNLKIETDTSSDYDSTCQRFGTRVQLGGYIADIVPDDEENPSIHHCIVQRIGSPKVLYLGQESTFAAALESGYHHLEELARPQPKKTAAIYEFKAPDHK
ncbi:MAG: hypothetical protein LAO76_16990 [Acidobacteriia bacterium]|nr:hypothetical protein [Terriglobia bacterium]